MTNEQTIVDLLLWDKTWSQGDEYKDDIRQNLHALEHETGTSDVLALLLQVLLRNTNV